SMLTPTPGTTLSGASVTFTWSAGTGVTEYWLAVGTSPGMGDLYSASQGAAASATVAGLPTDGRFLYVRLESRVGGVWQTPRDYPYRAAYLTSMLTVRIAGSSDGSVRSTPSGITCTTECNGWFLAGTVVVLTASPGTGGTFREWRGGCTGTAPSCMVTLGATLTVTAVFSKPFTDPTPKAGVTPIKAVHFTELREAINTLRIRYHLPAFTWSQTPPARGMLVTRTPLLDLRTALDQAYTAASRTHAAYTDSAVIAGTTPIRAVHLNELRTFVRNLE
ncbi:MAG TPA: hypothetical protein VLH58_11330, partial [Candidatus Methylomirabilis sp.]|nr:hypothetical protein [Candidatus Methylomirabilis sp.]